MEMVPSCAVRRPDFLAVGRDVEAFGAPADRHHGLVPIRLRRTAGTAGPPAPRAGGTAGTGTARRGHLAALLDDGHGGGTDIRGDDPLQVVRNENHVSPVLAGAEHPIDLLRRRIVAADHLGGFGREPDFAAHEHQAVRSAQRAEIDRRQCFLRRPDRSR